MNKEANLAQIFENFRKQWQGKACYLLKKIEHGNALQGERSRLISGNENVGICEHAPSLRRIYKVDRIELQEEVFCVYLKAYLDDQVVVLKIKFDGKKSIVRIDDNTESDKFIYRIVSRIEADRFFSRNHI